MLKNKVTYYLCFTMFMYCTCRLSSPVAAAISGRGQPPQASPCSGATPESVLRSSPRSRGASAASAAALRSVGVRPWVLRPEVSFCRPDATGWEN